MSKKTYLRILASAPKPIQQAVRASSRLASSPTARRITSSSKKAVTSILNTLSSQKVNLSAAGRRAKKIIPPKVRNATRKAIDRITSVLDEEQLSPSQLIESAVSNIVSAPAILNRKINSGARKLVNIAEKKGHISPRSAARMRFAIETAGANDSQYWHSPHSDKYVIDDKGVGDIWIKPSDLRPANREQTVQAFVSSALRDPNIRSIAQRQTLKTRSANSERVKRSKTLEQEQREKRAQRIERDLRGTATTDDKGNVTYDYSPLEHNLKTVGPVYTRARNLITSAAAGATGTAAFYGLFGKRKISKMMGGKTGRMGKEMVGVDGEKGRYFQKSRTQKNITRKFYEVDKPHEPQMRAMRGMQKRGKVKERITEFASSPFSPVQMQGYSVSRSYTTKRVVNKGTSRMARKIHEINEHNYYGDEKMKKPNMFRKNSLGNPVNMGGTMNSFVPNTMMPRRPMTQRTMPHAKTPTPMGLRAMNPMNPMGAKRFTAYPTARSMATGMPPTMRGGFGKRGR